MRWFRVVGAPFAALLLYACATPTPPAPTLTTPVRPAIEPGPPVSPSAPKNFSAATGGLSFADLPGWDVEDHAGALRAFTAGCGVSRDPDLRLVCGRARALGAADESRARAFLEANFRAERVGDQGLLTAYFAPSYEARSSEDGPFTAPVRARPADLVTFDLGLFDPGLAGRKLSGRADGGRLTPYPDRAEIEAVRPDHALAWMKPEELFFLQIQGSGMLTLPDGRRLRAVFSASNGKPFVPIARILRDRGVLPDNNTSGDAVLVWLAAHRGPEADEVMRQDPRYVFFNLEPDNGREPAGTAGVSLIPGRALAVDPTEHPMGGLYWIDARAPRLSGAFPVYQRLAMALDSGGAIKGAVRADLYAGSGPVAGREAGRVRHVLTLYRLAPIATPNP
jgi:membrane-bound lytic murein transglycosylase A